MEVHKEWPRRSMDSFFSVIFIYLFIVLGWFAKRIFGKRVDEKSLVVLSVYIFQPFLTFWGLLQRPLDMELLAAPLLFFALCLFIIAINVFIAKRVFADARERSIFTIASVIGNTGNLGVPLGLALFGEASLPYTTLINLANVFLVYGLGAYFYSRGSFDAKRSLQNTLKLPILWFALLAIVLNLMHFKPSQAFSMFLQMGAFTAIVIQLFILGAYLEKITIKTIDMKLTLAITTMKFLLLPLLTFAILLPLPIDTFTKKVLFMEMMMPIAIANVNLAALYHCKELIVTSLIFITTLLFIPLLFCYIPILNFLG